MKDELFKTLKEYVESAGDFLKEQTPEFVKELLSFKYFECMVYLIASLFFGILSCVGALSFYDKFTKLEETSRMTDMQGTCALLIVTFSASLICCFYTAFIHIIQMIKIKTAPKVFIVDYLTRKETKCVS